ncbi:hypothetical protein OK016_22985 [Vibrio chagasii]|nr:hypothetical protein [Vibrio chagasii]
MPVPEGYDPRTRDWYKVLSLQTKNNGKPNPTSMWQPMTLSYYIASLSIPTGIQLVMKADLNLNTLINDVVSIEQPGVYAFLYRWKW